MLNKNCRRVDSNLGRLVMEATTVQAMPQPRVCPDWEVVAQLVERSLLTPEIRGSNPVIGNFNYCQLYT